jgi:hypothetical protein
MDRPKDRQHCLLDLERSSTQLIACSPAHLLFLARLYSLAGCHVALPTEPCPSTDRAGWESMQHAAAILWPSATTNTAMSATSHFQLCPHLLHFDHALLCRSHRRQVSSDCSGRWNTKNKEEHARVIMHTYTCTSHVCMRVYAVPPTRHTTCTTHHHVL